MIPQMWPELAAALHQAPELFGPEERYPSRHSEYEPAPGGIPPELGGIALVGGGVLGGAQFEPPFSGGSAFRFGPESFQESQPFGEPRYQRQSEMGTWLGQPTDTWRLGTGFEQPSQGNQEQQTRREAQERRSFEGWESALGGRVPGAFTPSRERQPLQAPGDFTQGEEGWRARARRFGGGRVTLRLEARLGCTFLSPDRGWITVRGGGFQDLVPCPSGERREGPERAEQRLRGRLWSCFESCFRTGAVSKKSRGVPQSTI